MMKQFGKHFYIAVALMLIAIFFIYRSPHGKTVPLQKDIQTFPEQVGPWKGEGSRVFDEKIMDILRVDHYLDRTYYNDDGEWISFYIGYFADQKDGETIHSPRNCMPGSGWNFTQMQPVTLTVEGEHPLTIKATRSILVNGENRMLTYYWYQSRGRFITSEYWHKIYLVLDAIRYNRTDGALVRVLVPLPQKGDVEQFDDQVQDFIIQTIPALQYEYFPPAIG